MKEMERKSNKLILLMLLLPLAVVIVAAGCQKKDKGLYNFVVTSVTKSDASAEETSETTLTETTLPTETAATTETSETTTEETEETTEETEETEETTTKAEVKAGTKKATPTQTSAKKTAKATSKKTTKKTTKKTKATKKATPTPKPKYTQYLFVGDSRTVGLDEAVSGISSIAKVGAGVTYLKSVLPDVVKTRGKNVIFNFGVNDLDRYKDYITVYKSLPKEFIQKNNVIFMSVNPTEGSKYKSWNSSIDKFNTYIKKHLPSGIKYLNTNATLKKEGFETRDGCHYKPVTYKRIAKLTFVFCGDKNKKP